MATTAPGPNLTNISFVARQMIKFGGIALVFLIVGRMFFTAFVAYWKATHPPPPPPPTMGFGSLPPLVFPLQTAEEKPTSYRLETATGGVPDFGDRAKVFLLLKTTPSLLADQEAKEIAADYGFLFEPEVLGSDIYRWSKSTPIEANLEMNTRTKRHVIQTDYLSRPELLSNQELPDSFEAVSRVKGILNRLHLLPPDVSTAAGETKFLKALGGELQEAVSFSDADFIQVDLNRNPIDNQFRMYTPLGTQGVIHAILTGNFDGVNSFTHFEYSYQLADYTQVQTYPLRTAQLAWQLLQAGEGFVVDKGDSEEATVREVTLGYFDDFEEQDYLQPIYVFSGDGGFLAYVPALDPRVLQVGAGAAP